MGAKRILYLLAFASSCYSSVIGTPSPPICKASPRSSDWPSPDAWARLNQTINGKLLAPLPPAIVCDKTKPQYDRDACSKVDKVWITDQFLDNDPLTLHNPNWQNDSCIPPSVFKTAILTPGVPQPANQSSLCNLAPFAKYVVNASTAQDVVNTVKFARSHNLRLSIKNTGHDYLGRSTSPDFQLWTHNVKGIELHEKFQVQNCSTGGPRSAITVHAGNQWGEVYKVIKAHNLLAPGGSDPSVGVGGHLIGGGHGPLGSILGLEVDNVLEMTVVTPAGDLVVANECQNADLFWAMKGGGGSTFGVLVTATLKTHPNVPAVPFTLVFEADNTNITLFYDLLASMHSELVPWSDKLINGYYYWGPPNLVLNALGEPSTSNSSTESTSQLLVFAGWGLNQTLAQLNTTMWPFAQQLNASKPAVFSYLVFGTPTQASDLLNTAISGTAGNNVILGSWLWDRSAMLDRAGLVQTFRRLGNISVIQGLLVSGPAVRNASKIATASVTPAWRRTYAHMISFGLPWGYGNKTEESFVRSLQTNNTKVLQDHAPSMGAYMNEADIEQPDAPMAFWGLDNYERLLDIKHRYDPKGMFWCKPCVGWEEWGLNQETLQLCRK